LKNYDKLFSKEKPQWKDLVLDTIVEYIDVEETNFSVIAMKMADLTRGDKGANKQPMYTHMEVHPSLMLGVLAGSIPFSDHNQAPRNTYQSIRLVKTLLS
jgi:DNA-directed RNA polymerase II subunit RPB2